ncbi:hypothetical protein ACIQF5_21045 [Streptomyces goshikiensis]|uniref:hypothetical protein n=1 Tax=Streptomyces goshikiensis TaxID=1942 RepID=UPI0037F5AE15
MNAFPLEVPTVVDLFPEAVTACAPVGVAIGRDFDVVMLPEPAARQILDVLAHISPHPVGAAIACRGQWALIVRHDSGEGMNWPCPATHHDTGVLSVPPLSAGPADAVHWARLGNLDGRVFSAALPLRAALPLLAPRGPQPATDRLDRDRPPVRI